MKIDWPVVVNFLGAAGAKFIENCLSVKVWIIFIYMMLSLFLVHQDKMTGEIFATSNGSVISIVIALRESFKTQKIKAISNGAGEKEKEAIKKVSV